MQPRYPHAFVLNVMADDRPGIVSLVSQAVAERGGNIDACSQTVLSGYFTLIMMVSFEQVVEAEQLRQAVLHVGGASADFQVLVRPFTPVTPPVAEGDSFVLTAFGPDRSGIIAAFTRLLADKGINIIDLYGDRRGDQFVLISQLQVPRRWDIQMLQADLEHLSTDLGFTVRLQHENVFLATNQLRMGPHGR